MKIKDIVMALRCCYREVDADGCVGCPLEILDYPCHEYNLELKAADLIESLQEKVEYFRDKCNVVTGKNVELRNKLTESEKQLAESQRREMAAVETLKSIKRDINEPDKIYIHVSHYFGRRYLD